MVRLIDVRRVQSYNPNLFGYFWCDLHHPVSNLNWQFVWRNQMHYSPSSSERSSEKWPCQGFLIPTADSRISFWWVFSLSCFRFQAAYAIFPNQSLMPKALFQLEFYDFPTLPGFRNLIRSTTNYSPYAAMYGIFNLTFSHRCKQCHVGWIYSNPMEHNGIYDTRCFDPKETGW